MTTPQPSGAAGLVRSLVRPGAYFDSITLMQLQRRLRQMPGVDEAGAVMATDANKQLLAMAGLLDEAAAAAGPGDLVVAVRGADPAQLDAALGQFDHLLHHRPGARGGAAGGPVAGPAGTIPAGAGPSGLGPAGFDPAGFDPAGSSAGPAAVGAGSPPPRTLRQAVAIRPDANLALISVPGRFARWVAEEALDLGLHVFCFSDNVPLDDEVALKQRAGRQGLLFMGPDCGTAMIAGAGLGFANSVRPGPVSIVAASGTGLQEVACQLDRLGTGVRHAIGTGGRDLHEAVGGATFLAAIAALARDAGTQVIVALSKPPAPAVRRRVIEALAACGKPAVVHFLGDQHQPYPTLAATARAAAALAATARSATGRAAPRTAATAEPTTTPGAAGAGGQGGTGPDNPATLSSPRDPGSLGVPGDFGGPGDPGGHGPGGSAVPAADPAQGSIPADGWLREAELEARELLARARQLASQLRPGQRWVRGLYGGGTLCYEGQMLVNHLAGPVASNAPLPDLAPYRAGDPVPQAHLLLDLGADEFTAGRLHPMLDAETRLRYLAAAARDPGVAVVLLDVVLGYGAHPDPAEELAPAIVAARAAAADEGRHLTVVIALCGTASDPQGLDDQVRRLEAAGAVVLRSHAEAALLAGAVAALAAGRGVEPATLSRWLAPQGDAGTQTPAADGSNPGAGSPPGRPGSPPGPSGSAGIPDSGQVLTGRPVGPASDRGSSPGGEFTQGGFDGDDGGGPDRERDQDAGSDPTARLLAGVVAVNVGVPSFAESLARQQVPVVHADWRPPAGGNPKVLEALRRLRG